MSKKKGFELKMSPILFWVHQLDQLTRRELLAGFKAQDVELTPEQWSLLVELWQEDGLSPSRLAELTGRDRPSTSRLIESLKKRGLIKRMYSEEDRRAYSVYLTSEGKSCHETLLPIYSELMVRVVQGLSEKEQETLARGLKKLFMNLQENQ